MRATGWDSPSQPGSGTARGYAADPAGELTDNSAIIPGPNPSGGTYAPAGDLLRFAQALLGHHLLVPELTATVTTGKVPMSSGAAQVAYGFTDGQINDVRVIGHGGGAPGVGASVDIYPELGYVVVVLANYDRALEPVRDLTRKVLTG